MRFREPGERNIPVSALKPSQLIRVTFHEPAGGDDYTQDTSKSVSGLIQCGHLQLINRAQLQL